MKLVQISRHTTALRLLALNAEIRGVRSAPAPPGEPPALLTWFVRYLTRHLPEHSRDRYASEWAAEISAYWSDHEFGAVRYALPLVMGLHQLSAAEVVPATRPGAAVTTVEALITDGEGETRKS